MAALDDEYEELCRMHEQSMKALRAAYREYQASKTKELYDKCSILGGTVADIEWDMRRRFPDKMEAHYMFC